MIVTDYSLGRNTGNTFRQTYKHSKVQGVPITGPFVGTKFPAEDYVAMPIGNHELYVAWQDPEVARAGRRVRHELRDRRVYDYAPGSAHPESSGTVTVQKRGNAPAAVAARPALGHVGRAFPDRSRCPHAWSPSPAALMRVAVAGGTDRVAVAVAVAGGTDRASPSSAALIARRRRRRH